MRAQQIITFQICIFAFSSKNTSNHLQNKLNIEVKLHCIQKKDLN